MIQAEAFEALASSTNGIAKLRQLILELAVRGSLVPQDPNDEPASVLLERINIEKQRLIKEGKIKKQKALPEITENNKPYKLPVGWEWARLGNLCTKLTDGSHNPPRDVGNGIPMLSSQNVKYGVVDFTNPSRYVSQEDFEKEDQRTQILPNDVLLTIVASLGRSAIVPSNAPKFVLQRSVAVLRSDLDADFLALQLVAPTCLHYYDTYGKGTAQKGIYLGQLSLMEIAVPPLAEQQRIVEKVDELMALCDQLDQRQNHSNTVHQRLLQTLLESLTQAADNEAFQKIWSQIAAHFDTLFTTEASIDQLKQVILQLAVMGKLVPQDPNDEPASVLLKRIAEKKVQLVKKGEIKKQKQLPDIEEDEKQFEAPKGWEWCRLQEIVFLLGDGLHGTPEYTDNEKFYFINGNNLNNGQIVIKPETKTVAQDQYEKHKKQLGENSILVSINGTLGNVAFYNNEEIILGKSACYFNLAEEVYKRFIKVIIDAPSFINYAYKNATGSTIKNLGLSAMNSLPIALPPIQEQHRIVAKVNELMAICDLLKNQISKSQQTQEHLATAIVEKTAA